MAHASGEGVTIAVVYEGPGLPAGIDVFAAFQRGDPAQVGAAPGIGLGLPIVRTLVEAMDGSVTAKANAATGSTFTVSLPCGQPGTAPLLTA